MDNSQLSPTEQSSPIEDLTVLSTNELLKGMNHEDANIHKAVALTIPVMQLLIDDIVERMKNGGRLFYIGAGTSGRLAVLDASELPPTYGVSPDLVIGIIAGGDIALRTAVENAEDEVTGAWRDLQPYAPTPKDSIIGITASGSTPYVIGGLHEAKLRGLLTGCITCNPHSPVANESDFALEAIVGPEFVTGSTRMKAGTAQKIMLNMISTSLMIRLGRVEGNSMAFMQLNNKKLKNRAIRIICKKHNCTQEEASKLLNRTQSLHEALKNSF